MTVAFVLALGCPTLAAADSWWTYKSLVGGSPGLTQVDLGLNDHLPTQDYPEGALVMRAYEQRRADGLPEPEQENDLKALEARIVAAVGSTPGAIAVGSFSQQGLHWTYFYLKSDPKIRDRFTATVKRICPTCNVSVKPDPEWSNYRNYLYPNAATIKYYHAELAQLGYVK